ncbi:D-xylose 1-dehydrogenase (NADP(+)) 2 [Halalkalicoccus paucihalophilus]|uniref:D-xylose 1-dehydrogenase (NADP(+)) 2 n=1 Tax=Halalkalicoccus paucihalophilus TaxID=1008153 RepID=A0A151AA64_9EURY|nr:Gfo/Idh/MocA family oxidoreductase [Halalkalicoccus paucihalophilus]KYH24484.1 D-xylose 1-dehydrogenase (NADP(+)) 2 [Halalkalicoccus paucihalophilus]
MERIAILGRGFMATVHALRYAEMDGVEVVAVASPSHPTEFADKYADAAVVYDDALELYDTESLDAVDVCTPTHTHRELVLPAVERGLDVLCEKPLGRTMADARAIADAAADSDATVVPGHTIRFFPQYAKARERVRVGDIGSPGNIRTLRQSPFEERSDWFADDVKSGGVLLDLAIHDFDFLRWTIGEIERVFARRRRWDAHEYALATVRFENGAVGHVDARWPRRPDLPFATRFEIAGDEGLLEFDSEDVNPIDIVSTTATGEPDRDPIDEPLVKDPYLRELEAFVDCVRTGSEPPITLEDGIETLRVALAALESAERGEPVAVAEVTA